MRSTALIRREITEGIIVIRLPERFRLTLLERALALGVEASSRADVRDRLWVGEVDRS